MIDFSQVREFHLDDDFGKLVMVKWRSLCQTAYNIVQDYTVAEDVAAEAVTKVCRVLQRESIGAIEPYLYKAVRQVAVDQLERLRKEISFELLPENVQNLEMRSPSQLAMLCEEMDEVEVAMKSLSTRMALSVKLRYLEDRDFESIAQELKCPINTVKSDVRRGLKQLRKKILRDRSMHCEIA